MIDKAALDREIPDLAAQRLLSERNSSSKKLVLALLAAGASRRFGGVKLAEPIDCMDSDSQQTRQPLLLHSLDKLNQLAKRLRLSAVDCHIVVVLGAHHQSLKPLLPPDTLTVTHSQWQLGLSSSIHAATIAAQQLNATALMVTLADHIGVDGSAYELIAKQWLTTASTCCARYQNSVGVPAIFTADQFEALLMLRGDKGAKPLLKQLEKQQQLGVVALAGIAIDIDKRQDIDVWQHAIKQSK